MHDGLERSHLPLVWYDEGEGRPSSLDSSDGKGARQSAQNGLNLQGRPELTFMGKNSLQLVMLSERIVEVTSKGQLIIPSAIRREAGISMGAMSTLSLSGSPWS
jgi:hypothetical protein